MNLKQYKPLLSLLLLVVGSYLIHKTIFLVFKLEDTDFNKIAEEFLKDYILTKSGFE